MSGVERLLLGLVALATVLAGITRYLSGVSDVVAFIVAGITLAGLAWLVAFATEQVGERFGPAVTGVLQATVANLPEFFVVIFALNARDTLVAETAIVGSILVNAQLVLGLVIVAGASRARDGVMRFNPRLPNDTATLLLVSMLIIVLVGLVEAAHTAASHHTKTISVIGAVAILTVYAVWLRQYLGSGDTPVGAGDAAVGPERSAGAAGRSGDAAHSGAAAVPERRGSPRLPVSRAVALLVLAGAAAGFVSDWFVHALEPAVHTLHISQTFAGLVIVAIAGNAVENVVGIVLAAKGRSDLAISVVKNSMSQIAAFLYPLLVIVSLLTATRLTFALAPVYIGALFATAVIVWQITGDGEATVFEGTALIAAFVILATVAAFET